mmetsp:Transcript_14096/g.41467  ORF Transcript_14096/g.41467 Transcript_14096/m.41467 type:complete len:93 (+) Transcript_14096:98-376(+)
MLPGRTDTDVSVATTVGDHHHAPAKDVYKVEKTYVVPRCSVKDAQKLLKHATAAEEPPLLPRVYLSCNKLGASPQAKDLLSRACSLLAQQVA